MRRIKKRVLVIVLAMSLIAASFASVGNQMDVQAAELPRTIIDQQIMQENEAVKVIILMDEASVLEENPQATMNRTNQKKMEQLKQLQEKILAKIEKVLLGGKTIDVRYQYTWIANAVAATVPYGKIHEIKKMEGVKDVVCQQVFKMSEECAPCTILDGGMIGREESWAMGYTGKGMKIAVIDSGLDLKHPNFQGLSETCLTDDSVTEKTVDAVLKNLNSYKKFADAGKTMKVSDVYKNSKVAYAFDYASNGGPFLDSEHGTHVSGIAAANDLQNREAVGVAPDAQLYVMGVFSEEGAYDEDIIAAMEDALLLEADVINMSLGAPAGFTKSGKTWFDEAFERVTKTRTILSVSQGNEHNSGYMNRWGHDRNLTSNPDNGTGGWPASFTQSTSVASVNNERIKADVMQVNEKLFKYEESIDGNHMPIHSIAGKELDFAIVENYGRSVEEFEKADAAGKVAVVQRGEILYSEKVQYAEKAGAIACLISNNVAGISGISLGEEGGTIPAAMISMEAGEYLRAEKGKNPTLTINFLEEQSEIIAEDGYRMSEFTSWGPSPDLSFTPKITAPGGNIYSTVPGGGYGYHSGTSMAAPQISGISALIMQQAKEEHPKFTPEEMRRYVNEVMMSTAVPLLNEDGKMYSPRVQGAGLASAYRALKANAHLTVKNQDMPNIELKDNPAKDGVYQYQFQVKNDGTQDLYYSPATNVQTEGVFSDEQLGKTFLSMTPVSLDAETNETSKDFVSTYDYDENGITNTSDARVLYLKVQNGSTDEEGAAFRYNLNQDEAVDRADAQAYLDTLTGKGSVDLKAQVLRVKRGQTADVDVKVVVSEAGKSYMDTNFENGIYVEGYTVLKAESTGEVDLSIPYLGFYGDWTKAPIMDDAFYWESANSEETYQETEVLYTGFGMDEDGEKNYVYIGQNPYFPEEPIDLRHFSVSPNGDGYMDYIDVIGISFLRNVRDLMISYKGVNGELYAADEMHYIPKSFYVPSMDGMWMYGYFTENEDGYKMLDADGSPLENGTVVNLEMKAVLDYPMHPSQNLFDVWTVPIVVDLEAPKIDTETMEVKADEEGALWLTMSYGDNVGVAAILLSDGDEMYDLHKAEETEPGSMVTQCIDVSNYAGKMLSVTLLDYAGNEYAAEIDLKY